ncbi:hypothetical protein DFH07DRAFT_784217 [Mycena maculata]|uniref:Uncharacterized protein n=1 Tax=Mycena maculata TaxID=230809 RepID=A0AAD7MK00_9AGAR|nr:hypothetical protein DFH07DRAFT_784217 [Mycena maculata]
MAKGKEKRKPACDPDAPPKKRGSPSDIQGQHLAFLTERIPDYMAASKKGRKKNDRELTKFWRTLFFDYWRKFPWQLKLTEEPPEAAEEEKKLEEGGAEAAFTALDLDLTPEEMEEKSKVQKETKERNPYFEYLRKMRQKNEEGPPRKPTDYHFYLNHVDFKDKVAARCDAEIQEEPDPNKHIALRCRVAREMLAVEPEEVQKRLTDERNAQHHAAKEKYKEDDERLPSVEPEIQAECRDNLMETIAPLLSRLNVYTGYLINIVAARVGEDGMSILSANAGEVDGKDWAQWDPVVYQEMLPKFLKFVHANHLQTLAKKAPPPAAAVTGASSNAGGMEMFGNNNMIRMSPDPDVEMDVAVPSSSAPVPAASNALPLPPPPPPTNMLPPPPPLVDDDNDLMSGAIIFAPAPSSRPYVAPTPLAPAFPPPTLEPVPEPVKDSETWGVSLMTTPLRNELRQMDEQTCGQYVARLRRLPETEVTWENNNARQRTYQKDWGLSNATAFVGMRRKREGEEEGGRKRKKTNGTATMRARRGGAALPRRCPRSRA